MEFCPVCMLRKALAGEVESGESSVSEDTVSPTPEQAVHRFENYELVTSKDGKPLEFWVAVPWGSLTKRSTSICTAP
jgi:hypothetical protein